LVTILTNYQDSAPFLFGISYRIFSYLIVGAINIFIIVRILKNRIKIERILIVLSVVSLAAFLFLTKMHERYSLIPLVFILLLSIKKPKLIVLFIVISTTSFFNHYRSWSVPPIAPVINVFNSLFFIISISLINLFVFFYLLKKYFYTNCQQNQ